MYTYFLNMPVWVWVGFVLVGLPWPFLVQAVSSRKLDPEGLGIQHRFAIGWPFMVALLAAAHSYWANNWSPKEFSTTLVILWVVNNAFLLANSAPSIREGHSASGRILWKPAGLAFFAIGCLMPIILLSDAHVRQCHSDLAAYQVSQLGQKSVIVFPSRFEPVFGKTNEIVGWQIVQKTHPELNLFLASGKLGLEMQDAFQGKENQLVRVTFDESPQNGRFVVSLASVEPMVWQPSQRQHLF